MKGIYIQIYFLKGSPILFVFILRNDVCPWYIPPLMAIFKPFPNLKKLSVKTFATFEPFPKVFHFRFHFLSSVASFLSQG